MNDRNVKTVQIPDSWPKGIEEVCVEKERKQQSDVQGPHLLPGTPWPDGLDVVKVQKLASARPQDAASLWLVKAMTLFLGGFVLYGMLVSDAGILDKSFELVRYGLVASIAWALGQSRGDVASTETENE